MKIAMTNKATVRRSEASGVRMVTTADQTGWGSSVSRVFSTPMLA